MSFWKKWFRRRRPPPAQPPPPPPLWPPAELRFPRPPFRIDASLSGTTPEVRGDYLAHVQTWRHEVLRALQPFESCERFELSHWARATLLHFLRHDWNVPQHAAAMSLAYNIAPFPISAFDRDSEEAVLDVLRWRAAARDYFDDVCDAMPPCPDVMDCGRAATFLFPPDDTPLCIFCLTDFGEDEMPVDAHRCLILSHVRAKWPPMPHGLIPE